MPAVEVRLLGLLEVRSGGRAVELRRPKQRALLALLALHAGEVVSIDRLVEDLWGETPPKAAVGSLQNLVSELRKALGPDVLETRPPGYVLQLDRSRVDAHRFERLAREAQGTAVARAATLREALSLWRGHALADLAFEPFAQAEAPRLEELQATAKENLFDAELELGRHAALVAELEAFVTEHPLRERPRGQLMLALYRSGRQADALEAYRQARETLVDELGIDPSPELQRLEQAILRHDAALDLEKPAAKPRSEPDRRKTVTILFVDIVDSSALAAALDPEVLRDVMRSYFDAVRTIIERHGGTVEKFIGDAAMAVFGIPELHEDDALRAVRAAFALHEAVGALEVGHDVMLRLCIGINTGEVIAGDPAAGEAFATGGAIVLATRLQQAALPRETLVGETTYGLTRDEVEAEEVDPLVLGGGFGLVPAFRLLAPAELTQGLRLKRTTGLVGREEELARLRGALAGVRSERRSRVVTVLGEAGIGKTRLAAELISSADAAVLVGRCISYGEGATYLPLAEAIGQAVPKRVRATIASLLAVDEHADAIAERIGEITGDAEGNASTGELFWAVRRFLEALARERPVLLVFEDVHWAEPTLLDLVEYLAAWRSDASILVVCLARPELEDVRPGWAEGAIRLEPLTDQESDQLVQALMDVPDAVRARIVEVAEGNALFAEQLLAHVADDEGVPTLESPPLSIEALLGSRLDRLEPEQRELVERAAVIGREFTRSAVTHLTPPGELAGIDGRLKTLLRKGFIHAQRSPVREDVFRFHHVLVRDVAYRGLTKSQRADLHERHGHWLDLRADGLDEIIGYHFERACLYVAELGKTYADPKRSLGARAAMHLGQAGKRATGRGDMAGAANLLERATGVIPPDEPDVGELLCSLGGARIGVGDLAGSERALVDARDWAEKQANAALGARADVELSRLGLVTGNVPVLDARRAAETAIPVLEESADDLALARAWLLFGDIFNAELDMSSLESSQERALVHARRAGSPGEEAEASFWIGLALYCGPRSVPSGIQQLEAALAQAKGPLEEAHALLHLGLLQAMNGDHELARAQERRAEDIYRELGHRLFAEASATARGLVEAISGDPETAEIEFRKGFEALEEMGEHGYSSTIAAFLSRALCELNRHAEAQSFAQISEDTGIPGDRWNAIICAGVRARLLAVGGDVNKAMELSERAIEIASQTDALPIQGEAFLDRAAVMRVLRRPAYERAALASAVALFEQKADIASASRAKALLAELVVA